MTAYALGDVCSRLRSGKGIPAAQVKESGLFPVMGGNGLRGYTDTCNFEGDCAIIGRQGAACGNVRFFSGKAYMTEHAVVACANEEHDTHYLAYLLSTMDLGRLSAQSAQPGLSVKTLAKQMVDLPPLDVQRRMVELLGKLDKKISLNQQTNDYLESLIEAMLARVLTDENASKVSLGDYLYIKGRIGWKGLKKSEYLPISDYRIINGESLTLSGINWEKAGFISKERYDESPEIMLEVGDILLSKDGTIGKIGYVDELEKPTSVASGIFVIRNTRQEELSTHFIYYLLKSHMFKAFVAGRTEGSVIPHLYQKDFVEFVFPLPDAATMRRFDDATRPMFEQVIANTRESKKLADLRDALLSKLMSGEIDVSEIELPTQPNNHL